MSLCLHTRKHYQNTHSLNCIVFSLFSAYSCQMKVYIQGRYVCQGLNYALHHALLCAIKCVLLAITHVGDAHLHRTTFPHMITRYARWSYN